jgi:hypothetical protein
MEEDGGGLPQRPPRSRRRAANPSDEDEQDMARVPGNATDTSEVQPDVHDTVTTADADEAAAAESAAPPPMLHISDKHTSGALRSAKVDGYNFECEAQLRSSSDEADVFVKLRSDLQC